MTIESGTFIRDTLFFIKNSLASVTDPISTKRGSSSKFIMTSYPEREVKYPLITIRLTNYEAARAGMQTTAMDVEMNLEIRVWGRNQKEKDELFNDVYLVLRNLQFTTSTGSIDNNLYNFSMTSAVEVDEDGERGIKSRVGQFNYMFYNIN